MPQTTIKQAITFIDELSEKLGKYDQDSIIHFHIYEDEIGTKTLSVLVGIDHGNLEEIIYAVIN